MSTPELPVNPPSGEPLSSSDNRRESSGAPQATPSRAKRWAAAHVGEIGWALLFAALAGFAFAVYTEDPQPFRIYVVADPDTDQLTLVRTLRGQEQRSPIAWIGRVPVNVHVELLADRTAETA